MQNYLRALVYMQPFSYDYTFESIFCNYFILFQFGRAERRSLHKRYVVLSWLRAKLSLRGFLQEGTKYRY